MYSILNARLRKVNISQVYTNGYSMSVR